MNKVLASFEDEFHALCVDVFVRDDGTYGFEEYRRELDGGSRWQSLHRYASRSYATGAAALADARGCVHWLGDVGPWRW